MKIRIQKNKQKPKYQLDSSKKRNLALTMGLISSLACSGCLKENPVATSGVTALASSSEISSSSQIEPLAGSIVPYSPSSSSSSNSQEPLAGFIARDPSSSSSEITLSSSSQEPPLAGAPYQQIQDPQIEEDDQ